MKNNLFKYLKSKNKNKKSKSKLKSYFLLNTKYK